MAEAPGSPGEDSTLTTATEAAIRIAVVALLAAWCFQIVRPFITPVVWAVIIAVAAYPVYGWILALVGGRRGAASALFSLLGLVVLIAPIALLTAALVENARQLANLLGEGPLVIPPPPASVAGWPLVGETLHGYWTLAHENLQALLRQFRPQIEPAVVAFSQWLLGAVAGAGVTAVQFVVSIVIAGLLVARAEVGQRTANALSTRLVGERGAELAGLAGSMVRSVARGILGVAVIQSTLAGLGLLAVGIPGAGLLALLCLVLCVVQLGPLLVLVPAMIWAFTAKSTAVAVAFLAWSLFVGVIDNALKPLLLGRGAQVPMLVIFVGAIGGFLSMGIIGLFVGAIVLVLGYTLAAAWILGEQAAAES